LTIVDYFDRLLGLIKNLVRHGEEPPWDALYAPPDMHHYLQRKTADAIARGEKPPWGGLYAPTTDPHVANTGSKKAIKKDNHSLSHRKND
jgi:hypothetical protein